MKEILTLNEAARYLKLAPVTLYRRARRGEIPAARIGRVWRFHQDQLVDWIRQSTGQKKTPFARTHAELFRHLSTRETDTLLRFIREITSRYAGLIEQIILYGSRARGDFKALSDIDLLIVMRDAHETINKEISDRTHQFGLAEDLRLQIVLLSLQEWRNPSFRTFLLVERIRREGLTLYG